MTFVPALTFFVAAIAAWTDVRKGIIPNWLTGSAFVSGVVIHGVLGGLRANAEGAAIAVAWSFAGALLCALPLAPLFVRGALGGGDLKLFAALGAIMHPMKGLELEVYALLVAVVIALGQLVHRGVLFQTLARSSALAVSALRRQTIPQRRGASLPPPLLTWFRLGPSILVGALLAWIAR